MGRTLEESMAAYADGDEGAFQELYAALAPKLTGFYRRAGVSPEVAGDLTQQTFLRLHMARGRYRRGEPVKPWVFMIATNLLTDERRRRTRGRETAFEDGEEERIPAPQAEEEGVPIEVAEALQRALDALPDPQKQVILLHKYGGLPLQEVATLTGCTLSAVKVRAFRAYEALRRVMVGGAR
jgi:RNA polymerase sigma-70 factor (ECF subfamily)